MQVIELITKLKSLPPNKEVVFDWSPEEGIGFFKLVYISGVSEIKTEDGEEFVLLEPATVENINIFDN